MHEHDSLVCIRIPSIALVLKNSFLHLFLLILFIALHGCSEENTTTPENSAEPTVPPSPVSNNVIIEPALEFPVVYVEELDQSQEFYKEQHETSFSFVSKKNWFSFTAEKSGILTKILLFGKPNFKPSDHYGDSMHGFIREGNPDNGAKYGEWEISRDDIVNQLAAQGTNGREAGWITLRMRGKIPQIIGKTYFMVCEEITGDKPWFGAFAFGEGNPYKAGKFWLHPEHDLVFRTYVGKTPDQVARDQKKEELIEKIDLPASPPEQPTPLPISQSSNNVVVRKTDPIPIDTIEQPTVPEPKPPEEIKPPSEIQTEKLDFIKAPVSKDDEQNSTKEKGSLFNRLFKRK